MPPESPRHHRRHQLTNPADHQDVGLTPGHVLQVTSSSAFGWGAIGSTSSITVKDASFTVQDDADATKQFQFQASGISTSTTRTLTVPDANITIGRANPETLQNKTVADSALQNTNSIQVLDNAFTIQDNGDPTKQVQFQCSGVSSSSTRTFTWPNASGTVALVQAGFSVGSTSSVSTTSGTFVDLDGDGSSSQLRVDLTTVGGDLYVQVGGTFRNDTNGAVGVLGVSLDGAAAVTIGNANAPGANFQHHIGGFHRFTSVAATAHFVKAQWATNSGVLTANTTLRQLVVQEIMR